MECPFCGVVTDEPHESQEACIAGLHAEIDRIKGVVDCLLSTAVPVPEPPSDAPDPTDPSPESGGDDEEEPRF